MGIPEQESDLFPDSGSAADHGNDGHSGSDGFVSFEQAFLDIPVERSIEPGVSQRKPTIHHAPASSTRHTGYPFSRHEHHGNHPLPYRAGEYSFCPYRRHPAKRRQSVCVRLSSIQQYRTQTGSIHTAFVEQRTQSHHFQTTAPGRADCILGRTPH